MWGFKKNHDKDKHTKSSSNNSGKKKHTKRKAKGQFPTVDALKLPIYVTDQSISSMQESVKAFDGAIRQITIDGQKGFTVVVLDEKTLVSIHLDKAHNNGDFGQFSAAIDDEMIRVVNTEKDAKRGLVVIAPDKNTIDEFGEFPELIEENKEIFQWGFYPENPDDPNDFEIKLLNSYVSYGDLSALADSHDNLEYRNGEIVTVTPGENGDTTQFDHADGKEIDPDSYGSNDSSDLAFTAATDTGPMSDSAVSTSDANRPVIPNPTSSTDSTSVTNNTSSSAFDETGQLGAMGSAAPDSSVDLSGIINTVASGISDDDDGQQASLDDKPQRIDENTGEGYSINNEAPGNQQSNVSVQAPQNRDEFVAQVINFQAQTIYNDGLDISIDPTAFNKQFGKIQPLQFRITPVAPDDQIGKIGNAERENANSKLNAIANTKIESLYSEYTTRMTGAVNQLEHKLSIDDKDSAFGHILAEIDKKKQEELANINSIIAEKQKAAQDQYDRDREENAKRASDNAKRLYDQQNSGMLKTKLQQIADNETDAIETRYQNKRARVLDRRKRFAQDIMRDVQSNVIRTLRKHADEFSQREHDVFDNYQKIIEKLYADNYQKELNRKQAERDIAMHSNDVEVANRKLKEAQDQATDKINRVTDEFNTKMAQKEADHKREMNDVLTKSSNREKELKDTITTLREQIKSNDTNTQDLLDRQDKRSQKEIDDLTRKLEMKNNETTNDKKQNLFKVGGMVSFAVVIAIMVSYPMGVLHGANSNSKSQSSESSVTRTVDRSSNNDKQTNIYINGNKDDKSDNVKHNSSSSNASDTKTSDNTSSTSNSSDAGH